MYTPYIPVTRYTDNKDNAKIYTEMQKVNNEKFTQGPNVPLEIIFLNLNNV